MNSQEGSKFRLNKKSKKSTKRSLIDHFPKYSSDFTNNYEVNKLKRITYAESMNQNMPLYFMINQNHNQRDLLKSERNIRTFINNDSKEPAPNQIRPEARSLMTAGKNKNNRK